MAEQQLHWQFLEYVFRYLLFLTTLCLCVDKQVIWLQVTGVRDGPYVEPPRK